MPAKSWAIPVGVLSAIVIIGFVFVWWWFPRAWQSGVNAETRVVNEVQGEEREEQRRKNRAIINGYERRQAIARGEAVPDEPVEDYELTAPPPPPYVAAPRLEAGEHVAERGHGEAPPAAYTAAEHERAEVLPADHTAAEHHAEVPMEQAARVQ